MNHSIAELELSNVTCGHRAPVGARVLAHAVGELELSTHMREAGA